MRGAIFDLGGVAVEWSNQTTYRYIEEMYGIPADEFRREAEREMPRVQTGGLPEEDWMEGLFRRFGVKGSPDVWGTTFEAARYDEDVLGIVRRLLRNGYRVAALSNLEPSRARWLREHDIDGLFDQVVFSCEVGYRKPDLKPGTEQDLKVFTLTLGRLGLEAGECAFVDDSPNCVAAAQSLGLRGILYKNVNQLEKELVGLGFGLD